MQNELKRVNSTRCYVEEKNWNLVKWAIGVYGLSNHQHTQLNCDVNKDEKFVLGMKFKSNF